MEFKFKGLNMGKVKLLACLLLGFLLLDIESFAQRNYKVKSAKISFQIKNAGINVDGSFSGLKAIIVFDDKNLQTSSIEASIDANTIQTGITMRDNHLRKEEYFGVIKYPRILISSTKIEKLGQGYKGYFRLTIKGITKDVIIPFSFDGQTFSGNFNVKRTDFGVGGSSWVTSSEVGVKILVLVE